jgi:hypothetical protein
MVIGNSTIVNRKSRSDYQEPSRQADDSDHQC